MKKHIYQLIFNIQYQISYFINTYIKHQEDCDNCKYYGGVMCDHLDDNGNCLGWERADFNPIHKWIYQYKIKRLAKKLKVDPKIMELLKK